jgi:hypothetical protein
MNSPKLSPQANAALLRLQHADSFSINDVLQEILDSGEGLDQAAAIVEAKIDGQVHIVYDKLAALIVATKSAKLWKKKKMS